MTTVTDAPPLEPDAAVHEPAVLGALMLDRHAWDDVSDVLRPEDFWLPKHETIYRAIANVVTQGQTPEPAVVWDQLRRMGVKDPQAAPYLHTLIANVATVANAGYHAEKVLTAAQRRRLRSEWTRAAQMTEDPALTPAEIVDETRDRLAAVTHRAATAGRNVIYGVESFLHYLEEPQQGPDLTLPWVAIHPLVPRLEPGQLVVVGARPSVGKSLWGICLARHAAIRLGQRTMYVSIEMSERAVIRRVVAAEARVPISRLVPGHDGRPSPMSDADWTAVQRVTARLSDAPLTVVAPGTTTAADVRSLVRRHRPRLVIIDYLGRMTHGKADRHDLAVAATCTALATLALQEQVTVVLLSQLNRKSTERADKRPGLADLRDTGQVEQDADLVVLLHREDLHDRESPVAGELEMIVVKQREGPLGSANVAFRGQVGDLTDMAREDGSW